MAAEIIEAGGRAAFIHTDVAVANDLERMVQTAVEQFGGLDISGQRCNLEQGGYRGHVSGAGLGSARSPWG